MIYSNFRLVQILFQDALERLSHSIEWELPPGYRYNHAFSNSYQSSFIFIFLPCFVLQPWIFRSSSSSFAFFFLYSCFAAHGWSVNRNNIEITATSLNTPINAQIEESIRIIFMNLFVHWNRSFQAFMEVVDGFRTYCMPRRFVNDQIFSSFSLETKMILVYIDAFEPNISKWSIKISFKKRTCLFIFSSVTVTNMCKSGILHLTSQHSHWSSWFITYSHLSIQCGRWTSSLWRRGSSSLRRSSIPRRCRL